MIDAVAGRGKYRLLERKELYFIQNT